MNAEPAPRRLTFPLTPIPAKATLRIPVAVPEHLPARMLNEFVYCPRLFFYEWVEGVFRHSPDTVDGAQKHERADAREDALPPQEELTGVTFRARSVMLSSDAHGLVAKLDLIEAGEGKVTPVDYKRGSPRDGDGGPEAWPADLVQVCVQALVLRDNGYVVDEGLVFYYETRQRVRIPISDALMQQTLDAVAAARALATSGRIPPPLVDSPKCVRCSLVPICLPDETLAAGVVAGEPAPQLALFDDGAGSERVNLEEVRRLVPARDDLRPLYVTGFGLTVHKSGEVLQVKDKKGLVQEARIGELLRALRRDDQGERRSGGGVRLPDAHAAAAVRPGERAAVVRLQSADAGSDDRVPRGGVRPVRRLLSSDAVRPPGAGLDLMEGFRPLVADSAVLTALNTGMVTSRDFVRAGRSVALSQKGRSGLIRAYEQRMDQLVTHPVFGYRISYRRVLEVQVRLLARYLEGEIPSYPGFETR